MSLEDGSAELLGKSEVGQNSAVLLGEGDIRQSGSAELLGKLEAQATAELLGETVIRQPGSAEFLGNAVIRQSGSTELLGDAIIRHVGTPVELLSNGIIRHSDSAELFAKAIIRHSGIPVELLGRAVIRHVGIPVELLSETVIRHVGIPVELLSEAVIRHTGIPRELVARCVIRHSALKDLNANVAICHWEDLECALTVRHSALAELYAIFWIRQPYRLWTNRRYVNGVIELTETLIGNAIFEYVIEGVMQDIQSYLINAGLDYSEWTDIILTPKLIRRATTYGTVAALYARSAKTFTTRVIPTMAPVTITAIGDEERAMNHWREKMNRALEFYVTSQSGDVMITSTDDEEPVFSMEDIPPELTDYTPWYEWLIKRTQ